MSDELSGIVQRAIYARYDNKVRKALMRETLGGLLFRFAYDGATLTDDQAAAVRVAVLTANTTRYSTRRFTSAIRGMIKAFDAHDLDVADRRCIQQAAIVVQRLEGAA